MEIVARERVSFSRFAVFFFLESAPYLALAIVVGFLADLLVPWGWPMIVGAFSAVFALYLGLSIRFAMYMLAREKARLAGVLVLPRESGGSVPYIFAVCGAGLGWELYDHIGHFALFVLAIVYMLGEYLKEVWYVGRSRSEIRHRDPI